MKQTLRDWLEDYECNVGCGADKELITRKVEEVVLEFQKYLITKKTESGDYDIKIKFIELFGDFRK